MAPAARERRVIAVLAAVSAWIALGAPAPAQGATPLGIASFEAQSTRAVPGPGPGGFVQEPNAFTQAGGHPRALTANVELDSEEAAAGRMVPTRDPRDVIIDLPPGLIASTRAVPRCPLERIARAAEGPLCPPESQVGVFRLRGAEDLFGAVVNLDPEAGRPAQLGLELWFKAGFLMAGALRRGPGGYGLALLASGLPGVLGPAEIEVTLWGVPADPSHDPQRGLFCEGSAGGGWRCQGGGEAAHATPVPFLTMPTDCAAGPLTATVQADSWEEPGRWVSASSTMPAMTGCNLLSFAPTLAAEAETPLADEATGMKVRVQSPQNETVQGSATPPLREATVTLPPGTSINPAVGDGAAVCTASGPEGIDIPTGLNATGQAVLPEEAGVGEEIGPDGLKRLAPGHCPAGSKVGTVEAKTPLLGAPLEGGVYLAEPLCGGAGQAACRRADAAEGGLFRLYLELASSGEPNAQGITPPPSEAAAGIVVKLAARVDANPATGQLTVHISEAPQLPIEDLTINLNGGPRALLANPPACGQATTTSDLVPWSAPGSTPEGLFAPGTPDATPSSFYDVEGCSASPALKPGFIAGTLNPFAGSASPFTLTITRNDREQYLSHVQARLPEGLIGRLAGVSLCEEPAAREGKCPAASRIGSSLVQAGAGSSPLQLGGNIYLTGPRDGSPFGLSILTHARIGPFNLGNVVIGARIDIDPHTAALTITSDPLPQILLGIPLRLRRVTLTLDRPGFMLNPTDCTAKRIEATVAGALGAVASVSSPFAAAACSRLGLDPTLKASTSGHASATGDGAGLDVRLALPTGSAASTRTAFGVGDEANLAQLKLALPRALAPRLQTMQGACEDAVFAANPAACPRSSIVGIVRAFTPVLPGAPAGPVYLVSHGAAALPSLVVVLQGAGVRLDLEGSTEVERSGATAIAFRALPDVPVTSLELYLLRGPHSLLGAGSSLCRLSRTVTVKRTVLVHLRGPRAPHGSHARTVRRTIRVRKRIPHSALLPTAIVGQNGATLHRGTVLDVAGCGRGKRTRR